MTNPTESAEDRKAMTHAEAKEAFLSLAKMVTLGRQAPSSEYNALVSAAEAWVRAERERGEQQGAKAILHALSEEPKP